MSTKIKAMQKLPEADLRLKYKKALESGMVVALIILMGAFYSFKKFESSFQLPDQPDITIESVDIPPTQQFQRPPPPSRPSIPIEADEDDVLDDVTIEDTDVNFDNFDDMAPPPPPDEDEVLEFFAVSDKPEIKHKEIPVYPSLAKKAGIEGSVVVQVVIGKTGLVESAKIFKSMPMLDEAAIAAAKKCTFTPAKQRDKFVRVKMNIPFQFQLK